MYDVVIIGAGVVGSAIAGELSKYQLKILLAEKSYDVSNGATKANSAIVHAGYDPLPGTLMARFNVRGNQLFPELCKKLSVPFRQIGSLVLAFDEDDMEKVETLYQRGVANGVPQQEILERQQILDLEPNINPEVKKALWCGTAGVVSPYELAIALCENAYINGTEIELNCEVLGIKKAEGCYELETTKKTVRSKLVINAAGIYADRINNWVSAIRFFIKPVKGQYMLLNKTTGDLARHVIFQCPTRLGKGVLVTPTVYGNTLIGPDAQDVRDKTDTSINDQKWDYIKKTALKSFPEIPFEKTIKTFAGLRAEADTNDFIIGEAEDAPNFINVAGIKSPGLTSSPAIAEHVCKMVLKKFNQTELRPDFQPFRQSPMLEYMDRETGRKLKETDPAYGKIICKCEQISEGEIRDAVSRFPRAVTKDGVKRRVRAGMGPCQGRRCGAEVDRILSEQREAAGTQNAVKKGG
jgi:glycerol-3-phosphate dehydrogenase